MAMTDSTDFFGQGLWGVIIFLIVAGVFTGGGLFGNNNASNVATTDFVANQVSNQNDKFVMNELASQNFALQSQIADSKYDNLAGVKDIQNQIALGNQASQAQMASCCCNVQRSIDGVNYNNALNTASIIQNATANTQSILDKMCQNEIQNLRDKVLDYKDEINSRNTGDMVLQALGRYVSNPPCPYVTSGTTLY